MARELRYGLVVMLAGAAALAAPAALAQMYVCKEGSRTITGDRPPPECTGQIRIIGSDGTQRGVIDPPLTPEQRKKREEDEKRRLADEEAKRNQMRSDRSLLETYSSVEEIQAQRRRVLADYQVNIERANKRMDELKRERKRLDNESEFYLKRELPEKLKRELAANNEMMSSQDKIIADTRAEMRRVGERFDAFARRFRELLIAGATPVHRPDDETATK